MPSTEPPTQRRALCRCTRSRAVPDTPRPFSTNLRAGSAGGATKCSPEVRRGGGIPRFFCGAAEDWPRSAHFLGKSWRNVSALARVTPRYATPYSCGAATSPETDAASSQPASPTAHKPGSKSVACTPTASLERFPARPAISLRQRTAHPIYFAHGGKRRGERFPMTLVSGHFLN
jgi:hypothetical protein